MRTLGIVGITGIVGQTLIDIIENDENIFSNFKLYASKSSAGKIITIKNSKLIIEEINLNSLLECNVVIFATDSAIAQEYIPQLAQQGILCIDKSSAFRADKRVPLMVPEINAHLIHSANFMNFPVIASPNCCTIPLVMALKALDDVFAVQRVIVSTYQSVSGAGKPAIDILSQETKNFFTAQDLTCTASNIFPKSIAFNVMPFVAEILDSGDTDEEAKIIAETKKVLQKDDLAIAATSVRVPTFVGHGEAVSLELKESFDISQLINILNKFPGLKALGDDIITPREAQGQDDVFISRIRKCPAFNNGISLWLVSDNLRKGAALNAWQIVKLYISQQ